MLRMELAPGGLQRLRLTLTRGDLLGCNVLPGFISLSRPSCAMIVLSTHLSNKKRNPYENRITHRSIIRRDDLRDGSNFAAVNITRRCGKYRYCASHHLRARASSKPSNGSSRVPPNSASCSSRRYHRLSVHIRRPLCSQGVRQPRRPSVTREVAAGNSY